MNTDAVQKMVLQPLRAKRALALEREEAIRALPNPPSTFGQALFHGQIEYCAGKVAAFDEAIELVEHRLRVERADLDRQFELAYDAGVTITYDYPGLPEIRTEYHLSPEERDEMIRSGHERVALHRETRAAHEAELDRYDPDRC